MLATVKTNSSAREVGRSHACNIMDPWYYEYQICS